MNKNRRIFLIIVGIVLFLVFILYVGFGKPFSLLVPGGFKNMQYALIQETPQYYAYHISWESSYPQGGCASAEAETSFSFTSSHNVLSAPETLYVKDHYETFNAGDLPYLPFKGNAYGLTPVPSGTDFGTATLFNSTDVQLNNVNAVSNPCSSNRKVLGGVGIGFTYTKLQVQCMMQKGTLSGEGGQGYIFCTWSGTAKSIDGSPILLENLDGGSANIKMYKVGFSPPENLVSFYRLENNQCSYLTILPSQKIDNDYSSLQDCQDHIIQSSVNQTQTGNNTCSTCEGENPKNSDMTMVILVIIGIVFLIVLLIFIYIKTRKR